MNDYLSFNEGQIEQLETRFRAHMVNSLSGFKSANLVGTQDADGQTNLAIVSSVVHLGANPPLIGMVMRPNTVARHTLENLRQTECFTINHVSAEFYKKAHQTSARFDKSQSEFEQVGLDTEYLADINAPFVAQSPLKFAVRLLEIKPIEANGTEFVIGQIFHIELDGNALQCDGYIDIEALDTVAVSGLDSYHVSNRITRLSYAKPNKAPHKISVSGE